MAARWFDFNDQPFIKSYAIIGALLSVFPPTETNIGQQTNQ